MKIKPSLHPILIAFSGMWLLSGCATLNEGVYLDVKTVMIERIASKHAKIGDVTVLQTASTTRIQGDVTHRIPDRGFIFGHLDVIVMAASGMTVFNDTVYYKRRSVKARSAQFLIEIQSLLTKGSTVRIKHHYADRSKHCITTNSHT